ncbi:DUF7079 family protein [Phytohalomonas tamaricis]|uniref:DUF7079 family protein n=1 Tax=Phytohalomonas tamaricis TaxID=2081032 RepID=UPI000D0B4C08|nr:hypothetical protein [Phytohalomonas tamaricis]
MTNTLSNAERQYIWETLAEVFVDNKTNYSVIAQGLKGYDLALLEEAFFREVAPVCHGHHTAPIPPTWAGFDAQWLSDAIQNHLRQRKHSILYRIKDNIHSRYLQRTLQGEWYSIEQALITIYKRPY